MAVPGGRQLSMERYVDDDCGQQRCGGTGAGRVAPVRLLTSNEAVTVTCITARDPP